MKINPREEWKQMLREAWRLQRDFFYDPKMHGVDWEGVWKQYGSLADRMATRDDLEDLFGEMLGELNVGHAYHWGGDLRRGKTVGTGLLAADLDYDAATGFWQIKKIYRGDYPDPEWSSPLARAGPARQARAVARRDRRAAAAQGRGLSRKARQPRRAGGRALDR